MDDWNGCQSTFPGCLPSKAWNLESVSCFRWLSPQDQKLAYPNNISFGLPSVREDHIRRCLKEKVQFTSDLMYAFTQEMYMILAATFLTLKILT